MQSRLLATLEAEARNTQNPETWAKAICRSAAHFGRQGQTAKAIDAITCVRSRFEHNLTPTIAASLMLAEGIFEFFRDDSRAAFDRTRRAHAIAVAANLVEIRPTCSAWLALFELNALRHVQMAEYLEEALSLAKPSDHQALARASLVLAGALHFTGNFTLARPWYEKARQHATAEGDQAALSAVLYNVAAFRVDNVRIADAFGIAMSEEAMQANMEASSAVNYDFAIGTESFSMLLPLRRAQLLVVGRRFRDAELLLDEIDVAALEEKSIPLLVVDRAWTKVELGKIDEGRELSKNAAKHLESMTHIDEIAYVNARLGTIAGLLNDAEAAFQFKAAASIALDRHREMQAKLLELLQPLVGRHTKSMA